MAGTVTREEGTMLINHLAKEDLAATMQELAYLTDNPPPGVFAKTILHTIALCRNKAFNNLIITGLEHEDEGVSILAAEELARLKSAEARDVLIEHLGSEVYHVRKASAAALVKGFKDGVDLIADRLASSREDFYRATYIQTLLNAGDRGIDALLKVMSSTSNSGAVSAVAAAVLGAVDKLKEESIPKVFVALMAAGDNNDAESIIEILKIVAALGYRARRFEGYIKAFSDHAAMPVRDEAKKALQEVLS